VTRISVSGRTYYAALDPGATSTPEQHGWPEPTCIPRGRGFQFVYGGLTDEDVADMRWHLETLADIFEAAGDPDSAADARAIRRDLQKMPEALD
jgi:hypothetical protein